MNSERPGCETLLAKIDTYFDANLFSKDGYDFFKERSSEILKRELVDRIFQTIENDSIAIIKLTDVCEEEYTDPATCRKGIVFSQEIYYRPFVPCCKCEYFAHESVNGGYCHAYRHVVHFNDGCTFGVKRKEKGE